jgi:hypothetical protein
MVLLVSPAYLQGLTIEIRVGDSLFFFRGELNDVGWLRVFLVDAYYLFNRLSK